MREPDEIFAHAIQLFNKQLYFECHEELEEELWQACTDPVLRNYYQGLIQVAVGLLHCQRGNIKGARRVLSKSYERLRQTMSHSLPSKQQIELRTLVTEVDAILKRLDRLNRMHSGAVLSYYPKIQWR